MCQHKLKLENAVVIISMLLLLEGEQRTTATTTNLFGGVSIWYGPGHTGHTRNDALAYVTEI